MRFSPLSAESPTTPQQAKRQRDLERDKKKKEVEELRKLEVCYNLHPFRENPTLTLSKEEKRLQELEREEREAKESKERLEVRWVPHLIGQDFIPPTSQHERRRKELEEKKARGKLEVCCDRSHPREWHPDSATG